MIKLKKTTAGKCDAGIDKILFVCILKFAFMKEILEDDLNPLFEMISDEFMRESTKRLSDDIRNPKINNNYIQEKVFINNLHKI